MNKNYSRARLMSDKVSDKVLNHSISQKIYYVNDELISSSKDVTTIFHSPYKNGKRNDQFMNPTFISSNLFYPEQIINKQSAPKHNLIYNKNQRSKKQLYNKRMQRQDYIANTIHQVVARDISVRKISHKFNQESANVNKNVARSPTRSGLRQQNNQAMQRQLENLIHHREKDQKKRLQGNKRIHVSISQVQNTRNIKQLISTIKSQVHSFLPQNTSWQKKTKLQNKQNKNKANLKQWMDGSNKIRKLKQEQQKDQSMNNPVKKIDTIILTPQQINLIRLSECKKNSGLLGNILREQIKQSEVKKLKERKERIQFY